MKQYISKISIVFFILSFIVACVSLLYPGLHFLVSAVLTLVFGINALAAILPLYLLPDKNPLTVYIVSMIARMVIVTSVVVTFYYIFSLNNYVFFLHSMIVFLAFQVVEIQHLNRNKTVLNSVK